MNLPPPVLRLTLMAASLLLVSCGGGRSPAKDPCAPPIDSQKCYEKSVHTHPADNATPDAAAAKHKFGACSARDLVNFSCDD